MKLKRFVAIVVSLAMVLSIVPAFSLTASADLGDVVTVGGTTYVVAGENLVPDGGFEDANGNFSWGSWFSPNGSNGPFANKCEDWFYKVNRATNAAALYKSGSITATDYALGTRWNDGSTGLCSLANNIAVEAGKTYHVAFDYKHKYNNTDMGYIATTFVTTATASTDGSTQVIPKPAAATTSWQTAEAIFTAPSNGYVFFHFRWLGGDKNGGSGPYFYFDNFKVEEVTTATATNLTINYVDENGNSIGSKNLSTYVNAKLSMKDETVAPHVIDKDGVLYARDAANEDVVVTANATVTVTYTAADEVEANKTTGLSWFAAEWTMGGSDFGYADIQVKDQSGTAFTDFVYAGEGDGIYPADRGGTGANRVDKTRIRGTHWTSGNTKMRIVVQNNEDSTYDVKMVLFDAVDVASPLVIADFVYTGSVNGIADVASWAQTGGGAVPAYNNAKYYTILPEDTTEYTVTVNYGTTGTVETFKGLKGANVTAPAKTLIVNDVMYMFDSASYTIDGDATYTLTPVKTLNVANGLIAHYSLESDVTDTVNNFNGNTIGAGVTFNANGYATLPGGTGQGAFTIPAEIGEYLTEDFTISMWVRQDSSYGSDGKAVAFWDIANGNYDRFFWQQKGNATTIQHRGDPRAYTDYTGVDAMKGNWALVTTTFDASEGTLTAYVNGEAISGTTTGTWSASHSLANLVNRGNTTFYLGHNYWNNGDNPEMKGDMAEVRIYNKALTADEVSALLADKKTITVKYVDENGAAITDSTAVEYFASSATFDVPTAVTSSTGAAYELTSLSYAEGETSVSVTASGTEYTATYTSVEAIPNGIEAIPAVTVVDGNEPVLPSTVTVTTNKAGITYTANVTWDTSSLTVGVNTVTGTVEGYDLKATVTVNVLSMTFETDDLVSNGTVNFPVDVTGDFYIEFDLTASDYDNMWIYASANGDLWGSGQIGLGWDDGGKGYFRAQPKPQTDIVFDTNKTYRFLVHGNVDTDTYDLTVYDTVTKAVIATADDYGFRAGSDVINSITATNNGGGNTGFATLSNIKVYAPDQADQFATITFVATGSVSETYTTNYTSAEEFPIPHYDGHIMKTRTISGNTVTATYEATETSIGSWYMRNNFTDDNWISQSKYIGSHNAFADDDSVFNNEGGALYGDTGATNSGTTAVDNSRTQSVGVVDQLNAGVRYFDIRLSRQKDGTFATVHGPAFENFRDVAISMAQWAKENPGEVIILDFQTMRDALYGGSATGHYDVITDNDAQYGPKAGDDNKYFYDALVQIFKDTGLTDYMTTNWDRMYGALTNSGTKTAILPFGKGRAVNCQGGYFINRAALNNGVTYDEEDPASNYDEVVSYLDSTYANLTDGATISTIHAYSTPLSFIGLGQSLLEDAQSNNPKWIETANFYNWMAYGKGDVLMMNDAVSDIDVYYAALNKFNRTGSSYSYTENFIRTDDNVTINGAQDRVPFSTRWTVEPSTATGTYTIDGVEYTAVTAYALDLMQFDRDSVQPTGEVTVTFPKVSADDTTVDVLLSADGSTVYATAKRGEGVSIATTALADVIVATKVAPYEDVTVKLMSGGSQVGTCEVRVYEGDNAVVPAGIYAKQYYLDAETAATVNGSEYTVEVSPLTSFTWEKSSNSALTTNGTYNAGRVVYWGSNTTNRTGYAYATVPAHNAEQTVMMTLDVMYNNGFDRAQVPVGKFYTVSNEELKAIDLAGGADTTTALDALAATEIATIDFYTVITSADTDKAVAVDGREYTHAIITVPVAEIAAGDIAVKMHDDGNQSGIVVINEVTFTIANAVSVDGVTTYVNNGDSITVKPADGSAGLIDGAGTIFAGETTFVPTKNIELSSAGIGAHMIDGAQVRIGYGPNSDGKVGSESGLRFITLVDTADSLAYEIYANHYNAETKTFADGYEIGVKITAEDSTAAAVKIPATLWQTEGEVFTSALTNLAVGNFNRKFTATPYVTADGQTFYGTPVTRSIYQVAAGLLVKASEDGTEYDQSALDSTVLYKVLNAYVNQTGIRLSVTSEGLTAYTGTGTSAYSGEQFFEVLSSETVSENVYAITIRPAGAKTTINSYWQEYIRINNNNSKIAEYTSLVENEDGTVTITFDYASYLAQ